MPDSCLKACRLRCWRPFRTPGRPTRAPPVDPLSFPEISMNLAELKDHWETIGRSFPARGNVTPTSRDPFLAQIEESYVLEHLRANHHVLDIGCGDGSHTTLYARS